MNLVKHVAGKELTAAELRQRREAARARWGKNAAVLGGGAALGALIGHDIGATRANVSTANRGAAVALRHGIDLAEQLDQVRDWASLERTRREFEIRRAIAERMRTNYPAARRNISELIGERVETPATLMNRLIAEENRRVLAGGERRSEEELQRVYQQMLDQLPKKPAPGVPAGERPIIGSDKNFHIYNYQIAQAQARLRRARFNLHRTVENLVAGGEEPASAEHHPDTRKGRQAVRSIEREIADLERMRDARMTIARAGTTRQSGVEVRATTERRGSGRGGEKLKSVRLRIKGARAVERGREAKMLDQLGRSMDRLRRVGRTKTLEAAERAVTDALQRGDYGKMVHRGGLRGAAAGAAIGLTIAGLGILAHHVVRAGQTKRRRIAAAAVEKIEPLAKATSPEDQMSLGLAETYRQWIDRLLGRTETPMNMGDGIAQALAPGLTQAFADGLQNPPIEGLDPAGYHVDVDFDVLNPAVRRHMAEYALDRIVQITDAQREAIRQALMQQSVLQGIGPNDVARTIRESIGLTNAQQGWVSSYRVMLQQLDPRALERGLRDRRFDRTVRKAIETNTPLSAAQINAMVDAYHRRALALRARTIARTEALRATSYGGLARAQEVLDAHPELEVTKRWLATDDERTRDTHRDLNGREVEGMTTHFITSAGNQIRWPLDSNAVADEVINCRCTLQFVFKPKRGALQAVAV